MPKMFLGFFVLYSSFLASQLLANEPFPFAGRYQEKTSGLELVITTEGLIQTTYEDLRISRPLTTVDGTTYHTTGYAYDPAPFNCYYAVPILAGYDVTKQLLRIEFTFSSRVDSILGTCYPSQDKVVHHELAKITYRANNSSAMEIRDWLYSCECWYQVSPHSAVTAVCNWLQSDDPHENIGTTGCYCQDEVTPGTWKCTPNRN